MFRPSNRNIEILIPMETKGETKFAWFVSDWDSHRTPFEWGCAETDLQIVTHHTGRFTICNTRGAYIKWAPRQGHYKGRDRTFATAELAALFVEAA